MRTIITYKAVPNKSKRTFTIYKKENGKTIIKYRTHPYDKSTFENMCNNTEEDWFYYLWYEDGYYVVQKY